MKLRKEELMSMFASRPRPSDTGSQVNWARFGATWKYSELSRWRRLLCAEDEWVFGGGIR